MAVGRFTASFNAFRFTARFALVLPLVLGACATAPPRTTVRDYVAARTREKTRPLPPERLDQLQLSTHPVQFSTNVYGRRIEGRDAMAVEEALYLPNLTFEQLLEAEKCGIIDAKTIVFLIDRRVIVPGAARAVAKTLAEADDIPWYYTFGCQDECKVSIPPEFDGADASCPAPSP